MLEYETDKTGLLFYTKNWQTLYLNSFILTDTSPEVLNSSPHAPPPLCIFCKSLFVNTPDSDNQLVRSALRAMNCVPIDMLPTQGPLLPTPWAGEIRWSLPGL